MFGVNMTFISSSEVKKCIFHECRRHEWNTHFFHFTRWNKSHIHDKHLYLLFIIYATGRDKWGVIGGSRWCPWGMCRGVGLYSMGYQEEVMLAASFSVGWTVPLQGKVLPVSDYCPAAESFAAVAAIVAVAWLLSLPLTWAWYDDYYSCFSPAHTACDRIRLLQSLGN